MPRVLLSLGANLGHKTQSVREAMALISKWPGVSDVRVSPLFLARPWGYKDQDDFVNSAMSFDSDVEPLDLLSRIHAIEDDFKRKRVFRYGPRTLDIDIICIGDLVMDTKELTIPHPRMAERAFVLLPLDAIEPDFTVPGIGRCVHELAKALPASETDGVRIIDEN